MTSRLRGAAPLAAIVATAGLIGAGAVLTATEAKAPIDADTLRGYHAQDFGRAVFTHNRDDIDGFDDNCAFTTVLTRKIVAPTDGYILASADVSAARDENSDGSANLQARLVSPGLDSSVGGTLLDDNHIRTSNISVQGMAKVSKGPAHVRLQLGECSDGGSAFVSDRSISVLFVPFGNVSTPITQDRNVSNR